MKNLKLSLAILVISFFLPFLWKGQVIYAQNIAITDDDSYSANSSAMLDVKSLTKGMLVPRLTTTQRIAVSNPATGLLVFDTDKGNFYFFNGTSWINLTSGNASGVIGYTAPDKVYINDVNDKFGVGTISPSGKMEVKSDVSIGNELPIFNVVNSSGDTVFAVYEQGVRINVYDDPLAKSNSSKGGFAVGGFSPSKGTVTNEYLRITPDSIRLYIEEGAASKSTGSKGGFAVGGFSPSKVGTNTDYFNIYGASAPAIINPSEPRILWYPLKEALISGRVLVESPDSVGTNSFASGFESKSIGNYSQSFGYSARAFGNNSTSIGNFANAIGNNSFAVGDSAVAKGIGAYAFGSIGRDTLGIPTGNPTAALADYSFAFGNGDSATAVGAFAIGTNNKASGINSMAFGVKTLASGSMSTTFGYRTKAYGYYSFASGYYSEANSSASAAFGFYSKAYGYGSFAAGFNTTIYGSYSAGFGYYANCSGTSSFAAGYMPTAAGYYSSAFGYYSNSKAYGSFVVGRYNNIEGNSYSWVSTDPLFTVGNGTSSSATSNALNILKNGETYLPAVYNSTVSFLYRDLYIDFSGKIGYVSSSKKYKRNITDMENVGWIYKLRPVNYTYKSDSMNIKQYGLIAEEVELLNKSFVSYNSDGSPETVSYSMFITPIIKALQDQKNEIEKLKIIIEKLEVENKSIDKIKEENKELKASIEKINSLLEISGKK